ncbi:MAG: YdeI/OmpD-associated family protein [Pyrinomonadaceae bacterium]
MKPVFFSSQDRFRKWLEKNHEREPELLVGFYKVATGKPSMTWSESVDQALCFGWIDGIRRKIDEESYSIRFTPRNPKSIWSAVNIAKVAELTKLGLMKPAGIAAFEKRDEKKSRIYSYERKNPKFSSEILKEFKANKNAWKFFCDQPPSYRKTITFWVMSAKQDATRKRRLLKLIEACEEGKRL